MAICTISPDVSKRNKGFSNLKSFKVYFILILVLLVSGKSWGQTNYVSWDFTPSISSANYSTNMTNQTTARTTGLTGGTLSNISLNTTTGAGANTLHRTTSWPYNISSVNASATSYIEFSVILASGQTFPNSSFTLDLKTETSSATAAPNNIQPIYGYGLSPTFSTIGSAISIAAAATQLATITIPAPGNTTTTKLTIRLAAFQSTNNAQSGNLRLHTVALKNTNAPLVGNSAPILTAASSPTVDSNFNVTFPDDATWRGAITAVKYGTTTLTANTDYTISSGAITLIPSGSAGSGLRTAGSATVTVSATGYADATVTQAIGAGAANKLVMKTQPAAPASNGATLATQPAVYIQDQYGNTTTSTATITATATQGTWTLGGTTSIAGVSGLSTFTNLTTTSASAVTGATIDFSSSGLTGITSGSFNIPPPPPSNDECSGAISLTLNATATVGTNVTATKSNTTTLSGLNAYTTGTAKDMWYSFTPSCTGSYTITLTPTAFDGVVALFSGSCPNPTYITSADLGASGTAETITQTLSSGTTYLISVWGYSSATGSFTIRATTPIQAVSTSAASSVASITATLNGNVTALASCPIPTIEKGFVFSATAINAAPAVDGTGVTKYVASSLGSTGTYTQAVTGLSPSTGYSYNTYVFDGATYTYGTVTTFTTATPTISTGGTIVASPATYGTAGTQTSFTVSGSNMAAGILVTTPAGFEVSTTSGSGFTSTLTVGSSGTISSIIVYIRTLATAAVASSPYSGNVVLSSTGAANVNKATASSTITAKALTISGLTGVNKTYDGLTTASLSGTASYTGLVNSESFTVTGTPTASFATAAIGTTKPITVSGYTAPSTNYTITQPTGLTANITTAPLTITGITANSKTFDGTTTTTLSGTAAYSGLVNGETFTVSGTPVANFADAAVGTGKTVTVSGYTAPSTNYSLTQPTLTADINAALNPTISPSGTLSALSTIYGTASSTSSFTVVGSSLTDNILITAPSGFEISQTSNSTGFAATQTLTQTGGNVASTTIYVRLTATSSVASYSGNVVLTSDGATTANVATVSSTVTTKALTITGLTANSKPYDGLTTVSVTGTPVYAGLANNESFTVSDVVTFAFATNGNVGTGKALTQTGTFTVPSSNYSITQPALTANITAVGLTISGLSGVSRVYNATNTATLSGTAAYVGLVNNESFTVSGTPSATFADANVGTSKAITVTGYTAPSSNYTISQPTGLTADITKADQTISGFNTSDARYVGGSNYNLTATAPGGTVTYTSSTPSVASISGNAVSIGVAGETTITASQPGNANYNAAPDVVQTLTITTPIYQYRSASSGNWNVTGTWQSSPDGTTWSASSTTPGASNSVYIQSGHTVTLTQNEACNDLNIANSTTSSLGTRGIVGLGNYTLNINGKLRTYYAAVGTVPGVASNAGFSSYPFTIGTGGKVSIVGSSRSLISTGEWGAVITTTTTGAFPLEINLNNGQTVTVGTAIKCTSLNVSAGTLDMSSFTIGIDNGTTGQGDATISSGATLTSSGSPVFQRTGSTKAGTLTVSGTLILSGASQTIAMSSIAFNGTVEYSKSGIQTLAVLANSGVSPNTYTNLKLSGSGVKTLGVATTVNGTLILGGTASLALNSLALTYGSSAKLEYNGSSSQTTSNSAELSSVPSTIKINNALGVTLGQSLVQNGTLDLTNGKLTTGANTVTIGSSGTVSNASAATYVNGNLIKLIASGTTTKSFEIGDATTYTPVTLDFAGTISNSTGSIQASTASGDHAQIATSGLVALKTVNRTWTLTNAVALTGLTSYSPSFTFVAGDVDGTATTSNFIVKNYSSSAWNTPTTGTKTATSIQATGVTTFGDFAIGELKATPTLSISNSPQTYTGSAIAATVVGSVAGTVSNVKYDGSATAPTTAGSYAITADFVPTDAANYSSLTGASAGTFTINKANQTITFGALGGKYVGDVNYSPGATSSTSSTNAITYTSSNENVATIVSDQIHIVGAGTTTITAAQNSSTNYNAATSVDQNLTVSIRPTIIISTSNQTETVLTDINADVTITSNGDLTINADREVHSVTVAPGGKLTVADTYKLTAPVTLQSSASGTATFVDSNTADIPTAVTGTVQQYLAASANASIPNRNWYVSIPVNTANVTALSSAASVVCWNEPTGAWAPPTESILNPLRGYISVGTTANSTISFSGTLNSGSKSISLSRTQNAYKEGFNLVGNPYPSYVSWSAATKTNLDSTIWYRTQNANGTYVFDTFNRVGTNNNEAGAVTGMIPPMQAFWVRVTASGNGSSTTGTLAFNNSMRSHESGTNRLKSPGTKNTELQILRLQVSNGINRDETIVLFNTGASNSYDSYDSPKMTNANVAIPEIYTLAGNNELVINGMNSYNPETEIPLGFRPGQATDFSIRAAELSNFDSSVRVILKDAHNTSETDITETPYTFSTTDATATTNRFSVIFRSAGTTTGTPTENNAKNIVVTTNALQQIVVVGDMDITNESSVLVHNAVGQKLTQQRITSTRTILNQHYVPGVYMVTVLGNGKTITRKVTVY